MAWHKNEFYNCFHLDIIFELAGNKNVLFGRWVLPELNEVLKYVKVQENQLVFFDTKLVEVDRCPICAPQISDKILICRLIIGYLKMVSADNV